VLHWPFLLPLARALRNLLPRLAVLLTVLLTVLLDVVLAVLWAALMLNCLGLAVSCGMAPALEGVLEAAADLQQRRQTARQMQETEPIEEEKTQPHNMHLLSAAFGYTQY
jgi:hypothetical protein